MVVLSYKTIRAFVMDHPLAEDALNNWYNIMTSADFANYNEMKMVFGTTDAVGNDRYVFNIKGNHFRLIALAHFDIRTIYILFVGTHKEYDKLNASLVKYKKQ
jgi:mRNA interferase HigB